MKNILKSDKVIFFELSVINGLPFYALEYFNYLKDSGWELFVKIKGNKISKELLKKYYNKKYKKEILNDLYPRIKWIKNEKIFCNKILVLDCTSINYINNSIFPKKLIYNYGNDINSTKEYFKGIKTIDEYKGEITIIGDKEIGCKVDYHYPTCLNFKMFIEINPWDLSLSTDKTFIEDKVAKVKYKNPAVNNRKSFNPHLEYNNFKIIKKDIWDRANRLIPECKFYNKNLEYISMDPFTDSCDLRFSKSYLSYDINSFISIDTGKSIKDFFNDI